MLGHNVHCYLAQVQIRRNSGSCRYSCRCQNVRYYGSDHFMSIHIPSLQICCQINKYLIDRIYMYILGSCIPQIYAVYSGAVFHIQRHPRRCNYIVQFQCRIVGQFCRIITLTRKFSLRSCQSCLINLLNLLNNLKKPGSSGNLISLKRRCNCKANGLLCPAGVGDNKISLKRI